MNQSEQLIIKLKQLEKLTAAYIDFFKTITGDLLKLSNSAFVAINLLEEDNYVTKKISISEDKKYLDKAKLIFEFNIIGKPWTLNDTKKFSNNEIGLIKYKWLEILNNYFSKSINLELVSKNHLGNAYNIAISIKELKLGLFVIIMPAGGVIEFPQKIIELYTQTVGALLYRIETEKILLQKYLLEIKMVKN